MGSKKVVVVTVYNSENCGSYLQAYALRYVLFNNGFEVAFFERKTKKTSHQFSSRIILLLRRILKLKFKDAIFVLGSWFNFERAIKEFDICKPNSDFVDEADIIIIGSDTLWNFDVPYFKDKFNVFGGEIFKGKNVVTYAVSAANTSLETFKQFFTEQTNISYFLVRDSHTKKLIEQCTNRIVHIVCDPTLLLKPDDYRALLCNDKQLKPYILLYYFETFTKEQREIIMQYAKENQLIIVSLLTNRKWCDKCIIASPQNMILYFSHASCVITDTFHGVAFSLIYEKRFAVFDEGKNKVRELLFTYNMLDRLFCDYFELPRILNMENDVVKSGIYDEVRKESINILFNVINELLYDKSV